MLVAGQDALDQYFMREPERLLGRSVEEAVIDLHNPHISAAHLEAAAYEAPLTPADAAYFDEQGLLAAERLEQGGAPAAPRRRPCLGAALLTRRPDLAAHREQRDSSSSSRRCTASSSVPWSASACSASATPAPCTCIWAAATWSSSSTLRTAPWWCRSSRATTTPRPRPTRTCSWPAQGTTRPLPGAALSFGELEVTEQVIAYQKRDVTDGHVLDTVTLDLPEQTFVTQAFWLALPQAVVDGAVSALLESDERALPGALHAAEHALIALLPLYAMCDRWDIGGLSTPWHWQTDSPAIFVYDGYPGGIGLTRRGYDAFEDLAAATRCSSPNAPARAAVRRACRAPSAATSTTRSTSPAP